MEVIRCPAEEREKEERYQRIKERKGGEEIDIKRSYGKIKNYTSLRRDYAK